MENTFFTQLGQFTVIKVNIAISINASGKMTVSFLPKPLAVSDQATALIRPFNIQGTPQEIDAQFFNAILSPLHKTKQFFDNSEAYMVSLKDAELKSKKEKDKKEKMDKLKKETKTLLEDTENLEKNTKKIKANILSIRKIDPGNNFAKEAINTMNKSTPQVGLF